MPHLLKRYQNEGDDHFITLSCHGRRPYLASEQTKELLQKSLEQTRIRYNFKILGYVVMPEHVHLLLSEPELQPLSKAIATLKLSVSKQSQLHPFWGPRYYDFNVFTHNKRVEKLKYMHRNPIARGLAANPEDWPWSGYRHYRFNESGRITIQYNFQ